jgi:DNA-binding CsgD family transcriptional regulator
MATRRTPSDHDLSDVIGSIYDSVVDPAGWTLALQQMCDLVDAFFGSISIVDPAASSARFICRWGGDPYWIDLLDQKYAAMMPFMPILHRISVGEPFNMGMAAGHLADPAVWDSPFVVEWAVPAGVCDTASVILQRSQSGLAALNLSTGFGREAITADDLAIVKLLAPHVRRAMAISDLIDRKTMVANTFERTLDSLHIAVIAVDATFRVRHANRVARDLLTLESPLSARNGAIVASGSASATQALRQAITSASQNEATLRGNGSGIPLRFADGRPAIAHVLPLQRGAMRYGVGSGAAAAIFVATPTDSHTPIDALSHLFELTDAEMRVLAQISEGKNRGQAARSLSIADSTVKTHLDRIFSKTGTSTQAELSRLIISLSAPVVTS